VVALFVAPGLVGVHLVDPLDPLEVDPPLHPVETPVSAAGLQAGVADVAALHGAGLGAGAGAGAGAGLQAGAGALHGAGLGAGAGAGAGLQAGVAGLHGAGLGAGAGAGAGLQAGVAGLHGAGLGAGAGAGAGLQAGAGALHGAGLGAGAGAFLHPAVVVAASLLQPVDVGFLGAVVPVHPPLPFGAAPPGHLMVMVVTVSCATIGEVFWIILC